jgi:hypothetical protein
MLYNRAGITWMDWDSIDLSLRLHGWRLLSRRIKMHSYQAICVLNVRVKKRADGCKNRHYPWFRYYAAYLSGSFGSVICTTLQ